MALVLKDRVQQTGTANTTVSFTLSGTVPGFQDFSVIGNANTTYYGATDTSGNWEAGIGTYSTTGPTLTRTTILASSNSGSAVTFSGAVNVWVDYPAEKSVNLDASGNVSPLGTIASGTWQGSTVGVAYGGTGVTASSGANSVVLRDANQNIAVNRISQTRATTTASGGTTALTDASAFVQTLNGTGDHTFSLPDATTLTIGTWFLFDNDATGNLYVTNYATGALDTIASGGYSIFILEGQSTVAGYWIRAGLVPREVNWGTNSLDLGGSTVITNGTWQGGTIQSGYGGTGLTTFGAANYALYSTSASTLTAGTLPVTAGGTGQTTFSSGYIPYGNSTAALQSSSLLQFNGSYLQVGGGSVLGGTTNPIAAFSQSANNYVQTYTYNPNSGGSASSDYVAYTDNSTDTHGWADLGFTSSTYNDASYSVTGPNEAYVLGSAPSGAGATGNLVYATDSTGSANAHQWYVGGFNQAKGSWKMQLTSTGLQLSNALGISYGGTGQTTANGALNALLPSQTGNANKALVTDGSNTSWGSVSAAVADGCIYENSLSITSNYTFSTGKNGMSVGPITVAAGVTVTIPTGQRWVVL